MSTSSRIAWQRVAHRVFREPAALLGLLFSFVTGFAANGAIHAGNYELTGAGATSALVGWITAAQAMGIVLAAPLLAAMVSNGRSFNLATGAAAISAAGFLATSLSDHWMASAASRFLLGCGVGLAMSYAEYTVISRARDDVRPILAAVFGLSLASGHAAGTLLTGYLDNVVIVLTTAGTIMLFGLLLAPWGNLRPDEQVVQLRDLPRIVAISPLAFAAAVIFGFLDNGFLSMIPDYLLSAGYSKSDVVATSFLAFAGIIAFQLPAGLLCLRMEPQKLLRVAVLMLVLSIMVLLTVIERPNTREASVFVVGGLVDLIYTVGLITLASTVPRYYLASANACFVSLCGLGEVFGPMVTGSSLSLFGLAGGVGVILFLLAGYWIYAALQSLAGMDARNMRWPGLPPVGISERRTETPV